MDKRTFDIDLALDRIEEAVRPWPKAALFQLAEEGYTSTFEQLLACIVSIRTFDEVTLPVSRRLFARARTPAQVARLSWEELDGLISPSTFHDSEFTCEKAIELDQAECNKGMRLAFPCLDLNGWSAVQRIHTEEKQ